MGGGDTFFWKSTLQVPLAFMVLVWLSVLLCCHHWQNPLLASVNFRCPCAFPKLGGDLPLNSEHMLLLSTPRMNKNTFYAALPSTLQHVPRTDKLLLLSDFNARVGANRQVWETAIGRHGVGKSSNNGLRLVEVCSEFSLCITNPMFQLQNKYKTSWMHPRSKHWHLIDFVIVRHSDLHDVKITRAMRVADCWTDHRLIRSQLSMRVRPPARMK